MSTEKISTLLHALEAKRPPKSKSQAPVAQTPMAPNPPLRTVIPSRQGKRAIAVWLPAAYKANLRLVQARTDRSLEALFAEALNDLFDKYNVPTVRED